MECDFVQDAAVQTLVTTRHVIGFAAGRVTALRAALRCAAACSLQAAWRGYAARRKLLPRHGEVGAPQFFDLAAGDSADEVARCTGVVRRRPARGGIGAGKGIGGQVAALALRDALSQWPTPAAPVAPFAVRRPGASRVDARGEHARRPGATSEARCDEPEPESALEGAAKSPSTLAGCGTGAALKTPTGNTYAADGGKDLDNVGLAGWTATLVDGGDAGAGSAGYDMAAAQESTPALAAGPHGVLLVPPQRGAAPQRHSGHADAGTRWAATDAASPSAGEAPQCEIVAEMNSACTVTGHDADLGQAGWTASHVAGGRIAGTEPTSPAGEVPRSVGAVSARTLVAGTDGDLQSSGQAGWTATHVAGDQITGTEAPSPVKRAGLSASADKTADGAPLCENVADISAGPRGTGDGDNDTGYAGWTATHVAAVRFAGADMPSPAGGDDSIHSGQAGWTATRVAFARITGADYTRPVERAGVSASAGCTAIEATKCENVAMEGTYFVRTGDVAAHSGQAGWTATSVADGHITGADYIRPAENAADTTSAGCTASGTIVGAELISPAEDATMLVTTAALAGEDLGNVGRAGWTATTVAGGADEADHAGDGMAAARESTTALATRPHGVSLVPPQRRAADTAQPPALVAENGAAEGRPSDLGAAEHESSTAPAEWPHGVKEASLTHAAEAAEDVGDEAHSGRASPTALHGDALDAAEDGPTSYAAAARESATAPAAWPHGGLLIPPQRRAAEAASPPALGDEVDVVEDGTPHSEAAARASTNAPAAGPLGVSLAPPAHAAVAAEDVGDEAHLGRAGLAMLHRDATEVAEVGSTSHAAAARESTTAPAAKPHGVSLVPPLCAAQAAEVAGDAQPRRGGSTASHDGASLVTTLQRPMCTKKRLSKQQRKRLRKANATRDADLQRDDGEAAPEPEEEAPFEHAGISEPEDWIADGVPPCENVASKSIALAETDDSFCHSGHAGWTATYVATERDTGADYSSPAVHAGTTERRSGDTAGLLVPANRTTPSPPAPTPEPTTSRQFESPQAQIARWARAAGVELQMRREQQDVAKLELRRQMITAYSRFREASDSLYGPGRARLRPAEFAACLAERDAAMADLEAASEQIGQLQADGGGAACEEGDLRGAGGGGRRRRGRLSAESPPRSPHAAAARRTAEAAAASAWAWHADPRHRAAAGPGRGSPAAERGA